MEIKILCTATETRPSNGLWLVEGASKPYLHMLDKNCNCRYCESKIRYIIYPVAA
jgi:hypothetical protein